MVEEADVVQYRHDIFLSYAHRDNLPYAGAEGWVERFQEDLHIRLSMISGRGIQIWQPRRISVDEPFEGVVRDAIRHSALFMPILSPAYLASEFCQTELRYFLHNAGVARIIKVVKYPCDETLPLPELLEHRFYRLTTEGMPQELQGAAYRRAIEDLAQQVLLLLRGLGSVTTSNASHKRPLRVFLCHSSGDKPSVRRLYDQLTADGLDPWLDEKKLLPGQKWELEIRTAIDGADAIVVCISRMSVNKEGFLQKEIRLVLDKAEEKPEGTIFLIPARLEDCVVPSRLRDLQWVNLFEDTGYARLLQALQARADTIE